MLSGAFRYAAKFGVRSLEAADPTQPIEEDSIMHIASCTKLMTAIAVMQCVEKGTLKLDDDVSAILHEFRNINIIKGFDDEGKPIFQKSTRKMTLRYETRTSTPVADP